MPKITYLMPVNLNVCGRKSGEFKYSDVYVNGSFLIPQPELWLSELELSNNL